MARSILKAIFHFKDQTVRIFGLNVSKFEIIAK